MRPRTDLLAYVLIAVALAAPVTLTACAGRRGNVAAYYDPYYGDYHSWDGVELGFYRRWEGEAGLRDVEFGRRPAEEQRAYFTWRHAR